jgi:peptidyl-prolyl cis-trans isomerase D
VIQVDGDYENFNKVAADSVYSKRVARVGAGNLQVTGLENSQGLIRWAFNSKPGTISDILEIDQNYVVAALTDSRETGFTPLEEVAAQIAAELRREKKADMLAEKMTGAASLDALAQSLSAEVDTLAGVNFNSFFIPEVGADPALIGAICGGAAQGQLSKPIKALTGVYVVEITASETREETTIENERVRQEAVGQNYIPERAMQAITALSNVVDNRAKYY